MVSVEVCLLHSKEVVSVCDWCRKQLIIGLCAVGLTAVGLGRRSNGCAEIVWLVPE